MARVNYQREKRLKDLDRQRKQEAKRARKLQKGAEPQEGVENLLPENGEALAPDPDSETPDPEPQA